MPTLYHFGGAICAQKVRLALAEKQVEWESKDCAGPALRDPAYLKLNPNGVVPTLVHDDVVLTESRIISEYIDEAFDGPALMPADPRARHRARFWSKQIDDSLHLNVFILTFASIGRESFAAMPPTVRNQAMPGLRDPIKRRISIELLDSGFGSPWVNTAVARFQRLVANMEDQLSQSTYLAGDRYSLADADYTAYLNRLLHLGLASLVADRPGIGAWWSRMQDRPSFGTAIIDWQSPEDIAAYQRARECNGDAIKRLLAA